MINLNNSNFNIILNAYIILGYCVYKIEYKINIIEYNMNINIIL